MKKLMGIACIFVLMGCGDSNSQKDQPKVESENKKSYADILDNPTEIPESGTNSFFNNGTYERYLIVKGTQLSAPIKVVQDYADLPGRGETKKEFGIASFKEWTIIKIPNDMDYYDFHNLTYWFLGSGEDDPNHADESIGIAFHDTDQSEDYIIYNDYKLREELGIVDDLFTIKRSNNKILVSIPFDISLEVEKEVLPGYKEIQSIYGLNVNEIRNAEFEAKEVLFNE